MKKILLKTKVLTLKEPVKIPDISNLKVIRITGETESIEVENLFYFYPKENEIQIIPYKELIGRYYFKPIIPLFHLSRRKLKKKIKNIWDLQDRSIFIVKNLLLNAVEKRVVKIEEYSTLPHAEQVISLEKEVMNVAKTDFFSPPLSKYAFDIDRKLIDNVRFNAYRLLEKAISKKHQYLIRPKLLIEQYDYPIDVFLKNFKTIAYVKSFEIDNFSLFWSMPLENERDVYRPPNAFIFIRNLEKFLKDFKDTILHELAHFVEHRILFTRLDHNWVFYEIIEFLKEGYKTSYIERRFRNGN